MKKEAIRRRGGKEPTWMGPYDPHYLTRVQEGYFKKYIKGLNRNTAAAPEDKGDGNPVVQQQKSAIASNDGAQNTVGNMPPKESEKPSREASSVLDAVVTSAESTPVPESGAAAPDSRDTDESPKQMDGEVDKVNSVPATDGALMVDLKAAEELATSETIDIIANLDTSDGVECAHALETDAGYTAVEAAESSEGAEANAVGVNDSATSAEANATVSDDSGSNLTNAMREIVQIRENEETTDETVVASADSAVVKDESGVSEGADPICTNNMNLSDLEMDQGTSKDDAAVCVPVAHQDFEEIEVSLESVGRGNQQMKNREPEESVKQQLDSRAEVEVDRKTREEEESKREQDERPTCEDDDEKEQEVKVKEE